MECITPEVKQTMNMDYSHWADEIKKRELSPGVFMVEPAIADGSTGIVYIVYGSEAGVIKVAADDDAKQDLEHEARVYEKLGPHPRILRYFGKHTSTIFGLFFPLAVNGTLDMHLGSNFDKIQSQTVWKWVTQMAEGLAYIHSCGIVHGDFDPTNILLNENFDCLICDFAASSIDGAELSMIGKAQFLKPRPNGDYFSPDIQTDIFAFGCTTFAVLDKSDFLKRSEPEEIQKQYEEGRFPKIPDGSNPCIAYVTVKCWHGQYTGMEDVVKDLATNASPT